MHRGAPRRAVNATGIAHRARGSRLRPGRPSRARSYARRPRADTKCYTGLWVFLLVLLLYLIGAYSYITRIAPRAGTGTVPSSTDTGGDGLGATARPEKLSLASVARKLVRSNSVAGESMPTVSPAPHDLPASPTSSSDPSGNNGRATLVEVRSSVDGRTYGVAAGLPHQYEAADLLARTDVAAQRVLAEIARRLGQDNEGTIRASDGVDITHQMQVLVDKHYGHPLDLDEYQAPGDKTVGVNHEKGKRIDLCVRSKFDPMKFNPLNTMVRVLLHELAHSADPKYRADGDQGHGPQFRRLHMYLLSIAEGVGVYSCEEYTKTDGDFCGLRITGENYCGRGRGRGRA